MVDTGQPSSYPAPTSSEPERIPAGPPPRRIWHRA